MTYSEYAPWAKAPACLSQRRRYLTYTACGQSVHNDRLVQRPDGQFREAAGKSSASADVRVPDKEWIGLIVNRYRCQGCLGCQAPAAYAL